MKEKEKTFMNLFTSRTRYHLESREFTIYNLDLSVWLLLLLLF